MGKYGDILLGVAEKDGKESFIYLTFGIVNNKADDNWTNFLTHLHSKYHCSNGQYEKVIPFIFNK